MAKKQKRQVTFTTPVAASVSRPSGITARPGSEFNPDYTYVKKDLKNLGLQVALFLGILAVLTIFLR
ncbi:MAG: hypothetical protein GYA15_10000 [Leptolinea sp.]|jgi:hypothetical protein|nr:hypothetical protein [Leptolinea sp.]